ncbi:hypothetical protein KHA80_08375 [Anaerobacillus sp. HL2]|nr:hypothetical protein KHA80_08375 [Anaerobacillus sp. HL2]
MACFIGDNEHDEAYFIVGKIKELMCEHNYKLSDIAILYRTNAQSCSEVLVKSNINYNIVGGTKFYDRKEIKDLLLYLRVVANPDDDISLRRIINVPKRGTLEPLLLKIAEFAAIHGISMFQALEEVEQMALSKGATNKLIEFSDQMQGWVKLEECCL